MVDLDKLHEEMKDMSIPNNKIIGWIPLLVKEIKALREVEKAAKSIKCYANTDCMGVGITELDFALEKLDEARNA